MLEAWKEYEIRRSHKHAHANKNVATNFRLVQLQSILNEINLKHPTGKIAVIFVSLDAFVISTDEGGTCEMIDKQ